MTSAGADKLTAANAALAGALLAGAAAAGVCPWHAPLALTAVAAAAFRTPRTILCLLAFLLVLGGSCLRSALTKRPDLGTREFRARTVLVLDDARISAVPGLGGGVRTATAKLRSCTDPVNGETLPGGDAPVALVLSADCSLPPYGSVIEAEGIVTPLGNSADRDSFLARLKLRGVAAVVRCEKFRALGRETTLRTLLADGRDAMLRRLFDGVSSPEVRKLAAGLFCGVASGLPGEVREDFGAAGIIHIFSVSGMHVAVLALCFAWLLRSLPFRRRGLLLALLVWLYVLMTGAGTPAVRAGAMVTLWVLLRSALLRLRGSDVLCWTATLLLLLDPTLVADPGAQYSFLITGALLLLAERRDERSFPRREHSDFVPALFSSRLRQFSSRLLPRAKALGLGAGTAFLAGAAVSLRTYRSRLGTGAVAANILLALLMPGFFAVFFVQLFMGCLGAGRFTAPGFEWAFLRLRDFAAFFAECFPDAGAAPPHPVLALVYVLALLTLLRSRRRAVGLAAAVVLGAIALRQLVLPYTLPPAVLIRSAVYGKAPLVAVADPARRRAVVANAPDAAGSRRAAEFLRSRGIREIELFSAVPGGVSKGGAAALEREFKIAVRAENPEKSRDLCRMTPLEGGFRLDYFDPGSKLYFGVAVTAGDSGCAAVVEHRGKRVSRELPWSIDPEEWEYGFTDD